MNLVNHFESLDEEFRRVNLSTERRSEVVQEATRIEGCIRASIAVDAAIAIEPGKARKLKKILRRQYAVQEQIEEKRVLTPPGWSSYPEDDFDADDPPFLDHHINCVLGNLEDPKAFQAIDGRLREFGGLVTTWSLPSSLMQHLTSARTCYGFELYDQTIVCCRSLMEAAAFDWLARRAFFKRNGNVRALDEYRLQQLLNEVERQKRSESRGETAKIARIFGDAWKVVKRANEILHAKRDQPTVSRREALACVGNTRAIIELLFP